MELPRGEARPGRPSVSGEGGTPRPHAKGRVGGVGGRRGHGSQQREACVRPGRRADSEDRRPASLPGLGCVAVIASWAVPRSSHFAWWKTYRSLSDLGYLSSGIYSGTNCACQPLQVKLSNVYSLSLQTGNGLGRPFLICPPLPSLPLYILGHSSQATVAFLSHKHVVSLPSASGPLHLPRPYLELRSSRIFRGFSPLISSSIQMSSSHRGLPWLCL